MNGWNFKRISAWNLFLIFIAICGCGKAGKVSAAHDVQLSLQQIHDLKLDNQPGGDVTVDAINFLHQLYLTRQLPGPNGIKATSVLPSHGEQSTNYPVARYVQLRFKTNDCRITYKVVKVSAESSWKIVGARRYDDDNHLIEQYAMHISKADDQEVLVWDKQEAQRRRALDRLRIEPGGDLTADALEFIHRQIKAGLVPGVEHRKSLIHKPNDQATNYPVSRSFAVILTDKGFCTHLTVVKNSPSSPWELQDARRVEWHRGTMLRSI
jgi:hypothetical protein